MILGQATIGQQIRVRDSGALAVVLAHGAMGTLVLATHHVETAWDGRLIRSRETHTETWSAATVVEPVGQLLLPLG